MDQLKEQRQPNHLDEIDDMLSGFAVLSADEVLGGPKPASERDIPPREAFPPSKAPSAQEMAEETWGEGPLQTPEDAAPVEAPPEEELPQPEGPAEEPPVQEDQAERPEHGPLKGADRRSQAEERAVAVEDVVASTVASVLAEREDRGAPLPQGSGGKISTSRKNSTAPTRTGPWTRWIFPGTSPPWRRPPSGRSGAFAG